MSTAIKHMNHTIDKYLKAVTSDLPYQLISPQNLSHINKIARLLPSEIASIFGFECRLGEITPKADFFISTNASMGGRDVLAGKHDFINLPEELFTNSVWQKIRDFSLCWANPESQLYDNADNIWLEFDVDGKPPDIPIPSLFFGVKKLMFPPKKHFRLGESAHLFQWRTETALKLLGANSSFKSYDNICHCFNLLPPGAEVFTIGVMLSRQSESVRLCICGIPTENIVDYLINIGWTGSYKIIKELITNLSKFVNVINIAFDVGNIIYPKIGFECPVGTCKPNDAILQKFLDYLIEAEMCLPNKRDALLSYPGFCDEISNSELWPTNLINMSNFLGSQQLSTFLKTVNHIKIVYEPEKALEAKAYLFFEHGWVSTSAFNNFKQKQKNLNSTINY
ncbi:MAG: hypothetical protein KME64_22885 [Scytonematopsis contorta HA4267-MV1]|jgi:hypothetical protein|nr:hypothetical protein [Scytonematopsis contorta HA4267-MV1]